MRLFQGDPIARDNGFVEGESRFGAVPVDEIANRVVIRSLGTRRCETVQNGRFGLLQIGEAENGFRRAFTFIFRHIRILMRELIEVCMTNQRDGRLRRYAAPNDLTARTYQSG